MEISGFDQCVGHWIQSVSLISGAWGKHEHENLSRREAGKIMYRSPSISKWPISFTTSKSDMFFDWSTFTSVPFSDHGNGRTELGGGKSRLISSDNWTTRGVGSFQRILYLVWWKTSKAYDANPTEKREWALFNISFFVKLMVPLP